MCEKYLSLHGEYNKFMVVSVAKNCLQIPQKSLIVFFWLKKNLVNFFIMGRKKTWV